MKLELLFSGASTMPDGKIIHSTSDCYGNILVIDYPRYRVMSFDSIYEQSGFYTEKPYVLVYEYTRMMMLVLGFAIPRHATLLGLGGGSLLRSLHHYLPHCHFHVVELRPEVYKVAKEYFDIPDDRRVSVTFEDAEVQMKSGKDSGTDIIFADLYDAYCMSPVLAQQQFVRDSWRTLTKHGWLVINFHHLPDRDSPFFECLSDYFGTVMVGSCQLGNHILFACKSSDVDFSRAPANLKKMEGIINNDFVPLLMRLKPLAVSA